MAQARVHSLDITWNVRIGRALQTAISTVGWSNKEAAAALGVDAAELGKWLSGIRRPQLDKVFAIEELRWPVIAALAALDEQCEVVTEIRRRA